MRIIHGEGYSHEDRLGFISLIFDNIAKNTTTLMEAADEWGYQLTETNQVCSVLSLSLCHLIYYCINRLQDSADKIWKFDKSMQSMFQSVYVPLIASTWAV